MTFRVYVRDAQAAYQLAADDVPTFDQATRTARMLLVTNPRPVGMLITCNTSGSAWTRFFGSVSDTAWRANGSMRNYLLVE